MEKEPQGCDQTEGQNDLETSKQQKENGLSVSNTPRKRVSQACDRCRSRKDKCDGKKPVCSTCAALHQVCSYDPATKKRGLPEGYVRGLEKLWGLTIREAAGVEDLILSVLNSADLNDLDNLSRIWNDRGGPETLLETWRKSKISRELERLLPILDSVEEKPGKRKRPETGQSRAEAAVEHPQTFGQPPVPDRDLSSEASYWNQDDLRATLPNPDPQRRRVLEILTAPAEVKNSNALPELPSRAWQLLDVFFSYTHCWLPIIEKHDLLRTSYQYSQGGTDISIFRAGSGDHAALWAVLAYGKYQQDVVANTNVETGPQWMVDSLYAHAKTLIPIDEGIFELGHVQALLVLALLNMGRNFWNRAWLLVGQAVRISINLDLDKEPYDNKLDAKAAYIKSRSKHVFLGCFALDTLIAARLGRTPQLRKEDADRVGLVEEDGPDEWNPWIDCLEVRRSTPNGPHGPTAVLSTFNRLILLLKLLNTVTVDVSTGMRRVDVCSQLLNELESWGQVLPALLDPLSKPPLLLHRFHLHLAHISIIATVYKHLSVCSKEVKVSNITIAGTFATTARQTMWLLLRQSEGFGLSIVPPTYDYFTKIACESAQAVPDNMDDDNVTYNEWGRNMERSLTSMEKAWPTFEARRISLTNQLAAYTYHYRSPSAAKFPRVGSFELPQSLPSHNKQTSISDSIYSLNGGHSTASYNPVMTLASPTQLPPVDTSSPSWHDQRLGTTSFIEQPSADQLHFPDGSLGSEIDGDSMFNDFAALDAMEWTSNWDQSLVNLGFTDPDNMNRDFYAFCREPDPLYSTTLVQQLLSSSSHADSLPGAPSSGGSGMRFDDGARTGAEIGGLGVAFSNPHVEASQILQALSGGQGHSGGGA